MPRSYMHIQEYTEDILKLKEQGLSKREIGEQLGFSKEQIKEFLKRHKRKEQQIAAGITPKKKGRPPKIDIVTEQDKDDKIRALEMENELLRDFLSLIEGK